jgi:hypothetical protein
MIVVGRSDGFAYQTDAIKKQLANTFQTSPANGEFKPVASLTSGRFNGFNHGWPGE